MSVEHRRPLVAFLAVVALAIAIVASNFQTGQVGNLVRRVPAVASVQLAPDVLLGRALNAIPGRPAAPTLSASPDVDRADRAAAGTAAADSVVDRDDRITGSAAGAVGVTLTRQQGTRNTAAAATGSRPTAGVTTPARPSTGDNGSGTGPGAGQAPPTTTQPVPAPAETRGNGVVRRAVRGVIGVVEDTGRKVGHRAEHAVERVVDRLPSLAARRERGRGVTAGGPGRGRAGLDRGRSSVAGTPGLVRRDAHRSVGEGHGPRAALVQRPVGHHSPKAAQPAPPTSAAVRHDSHPHQGHRASTVDRAVVPRVPRVEVGRGHGPRHAATRAPRQARPDHAPRPQRAAVPARGPQGDHGGGRGSHGHH